MKYRLTDSYILRGWDRLPYAVVNLQTGEAVFFRKSEFELIRKCDGMEEIDSEALLPQQQDALKKALADHVIEEDEKGQGLLEVQKYKKYPCRYKQRALWAITGRCNYQCRHCFMSSPHNPFPELTTKELLSVVDQLSECGVASIQLTGGEPLLRKDFYQLVEALSQRNIRIESILTNGSLVNQELLDRLKEQNQHPSFQISYDGVGCHDWMRRVPEAEQKSEQAILFLTQNGYAVDVGMCVCRKNAHTIRETVNHLAELGVSMLTINEMAEEGEWKREGKDDRLGFEELMGVYLDYIPRYFADGAPLAIRMDGAFSYAPGKEHYSIDSCISLGSRKEERTPSCRKIRTQFYIDPEGKILPCNSMAGSRVEDEASNLFLSPLREILGESDFMEKCCATVREVRDADPKCRECLYIDRCIGGCRAAAVKENTSYLSSDPWMCRFFFGGWDKKIEEAAAEPFRLYKQGKAFDAKTSMK